MFCEKCDQNFCNDFCFCPKCGNKLIDNDDLQTKISQKIITEFDSLRSLNPNQKVAIFASKGPFKFDFEFELQNASIRLGNYLDSSLIIIKAE